MPRAPDGAVAAAGRNRGPMRRLKPVVSAPADRAREAMAGNIAAMTGLAAGAGLALLRGRPAVTVALGLRRPIVALYFVLPQLSLIRFVPDSLAYYVPLCLKRQGDRTLDRPAWGYRGHPRPRRPGRLPLRQDPPPPVAAAEPPGLEPVAVSGSQTMRTLNMACCISVLYWCIKSARVRRRGSEGGAA
jgi:hypothetical protein